MRYFQYTTKVYYDAEYPVYQNLGSTDKTKNYFIVKSHDKVRRQTLITRTRTDPTIFVGRVESVDDA